MSFQIPGIEEFVENITKSIQGNNTNTNSNNTRSKQRSKGFILTDSELKLGDTPIFNVVPDFIKTEGELTRYRETVSNPDKSSLCGKDCGEVINPASWNCYIQKIINNCGGSTGLGNIFGDQLGTAMIMGVAGIVLLVIMIKL